MAFAPLFYPDADAWRQTRARRVMLFGMSGLGKTHTAQMLRESGGWFHYSVDYRIGTRYMDEFIADNFKREAMKVPLLRELLLSDSVYIQSNITFDNLAPLSTYLGKPGDPIRGGLSLTEYRKRQDQHREAEIAAMLDTPRFIERAIEIYGYFDFICDTSGSICEIVNPDDPKDPVMSTLSRHLLPVWIEGSEAHTEQLIRRFSRAPKPMYYQAEFLTLAWSEYLSEFKCMDDDVDPDSFIRWAYAQALAHRAPRYAAMARNWGVTVAADDVACLRDPQDFDDLVADALAARTAEG